MSNGTSTSDSGFDAVDFFHVGGALSVDAPSYVKRQADASLLNAVSAGKYCTVSVPHQMGKSSLMVRVAQRLAESGSQTAMIDLRSLDQAEVSAEAWYFGLVRSLRQQFRLPVDEAPWWEEHGHLAPVQRFLDFLRHVILEQLSERIVLFIDDIDAILDCSFSDDFFVAIRAAHDARASDPAYARLTIVLLGVVSPIEQTTNGAPSAPYTIGPVMGLRDFTANQARVLLRGLHPIEYPEVILLRVLYWTGGHPYLTQKFCAAVVRAHQAQSPSAAWSNSRIDAVAAQLFFNDAASQAPHFQFIRDWIQAHGDRDALLQLYHRIWAGESVQDEAQSLTKRQLKLVGLVRARSDKTLGVRNRIYHRVFDEAWVRTMLPASAPAMETAPGPPTESASSPIPWLLIAVIAILVVVILAVTVL